MSTARRPGRCPGLRAGRRGTSRMPRPCSRPAWPGWSIAHGCCAAASRSAHRLDSRATSRHGCARRSRAASVTAAVPPAWWPTWIASSRSMTGTGSRPATSRCGRSPLDRVAGARKRCHCPHRQRRVRHPAAVDYGAPGRAAGPADSRRRVAPSGSPCRRWHRSAAHGPRWGSPRSSRPETRIARRSPTSSWPSRSPQCTVRRSAAAGEFEIAAGNLRA